MLPRILASLAASSLLMGGSMADFRSAMPQDFHPGHARRSREPEGLRFHAFLKKVDRRRMRNRMARKSRRINRQH